jgi:hypothetical protein
VNFVEKVELAAATILQHGDVVFNSSSNGILGGLYLGPVSAATCIAGFQITASGSNSQIQALINGGTAGASLVTAAGHHYALTTRFYSLEIYRQQQIFHAASEPAGSGLGGGLLAANVRFVLEVHDLDPANPGSMVAPSTVLCDGVISGAPTFCTFALVNSPGLHCSIAFNRFMPLTRRCEARCQAKTIGRGWWGRFHLGPNAISILGRRSTFSASTCRH